MSPPHPAPRLFSSKSRYQKLGAFKEPTPNNIQSSFPTHTTSTHNITDPTPVSVTPPRPDIVASATRVTKTENHLSTYNKITQSDDVQCLLKSLKHRLALNQISIHDDEFFEYLQLELIDLSL